MDGLKLLYQAHCYALDVDRDPWVFAVEVDTLLNVGMTTADFRWMVCKAYMLHAREVEPNDNGDREFRFVGSLKFSTDTCFRLTDLGLEFVKSLFDGGSSSDPQFEPQSPGESTPVSTPTESEVVPHWDGERHQFLVNGCVVKEFRVPSPNQQTILAAFEEDGWPIRIDDPLSQSTQIDGKRRLHDTIKSLNRNQRAHLIRFMGDGTGEGVRWELVSRNGRSYDSNGSLKR